MNGLLVALNWPNAVSNSSSVYWPTLVWNSITKISHSRTAWLYSSCSRVLDTASRKSSHITSSRKTPRSTQSLFLRLIYISNSCRSFSSSTEDARNIFFLIITTVHYFYGNIAYALAACHARKCIWNHLFLFPHTHTAHKYICRSMHNARHGSVLSPGTSQRIYTRR